MKLANLYLVMVLLLLLLVIPPSTAVKPSQQSNSGITLVIPLFQYYPRNDTASSGLHIHVYNTTSGQNISSTALNCSIHIYNSSDNHILRSTMIADGEDMEFVLPNNITSTRGFYEYITWCNTTGGAYGWAQDSFVMNYEGEGIIFDGGWQIAALLILLPVIFAFFIMKWSDDLGEEHFAMRFGLRMFAIFMLFMSIQAAYLAVLKYFIWQRMLDNIGTFTYIMGSLLAIMLFYFLIMYIKKMFEEINRHRKREDE